MLSRSQVTAQFGLNSSHIQELTARGVLPIKEGCTPRRPKYSREQVGGLVEDEHYVVCRACGMWAGQISPKHLKVCSNLSYREYTERWPKAPLFCGVVAENKAKTEEQKRRQSETLKARFKTPAGEITRQQISTAARLKMDSGYRVVAAAHLTQLNKSPERRAANSRRMKALWEVGSIREVVEGYHRENPEASRAQLAEARKNIDPDHARRLAQRNARKKTSKMHLLFKERMIEAGMGEFFTEYLVLGYLVDEALPDLHLAVEIDGCYWHGCPECGCAGVEKTLANDRAKSRYLTLKGWTLLRLPGHLVRKDPEVAISLIREEIRLLSKEAS
jgi:very-short-patch-repair endonuclease